MPQRDVIMRHQLELDQFMNMRNDWTDEDLEYFMRQLDIKEQGWR
jgi:hypothetical protein